MNARHHPAVEHDAEQEGLILDMLDRFLAVEVKPYVHKLEHDDIYPAEIVEKMKEMGLFGCIIEPNTAAWAFPPPPTPRSSSACRRCGCRSPASSTRT
jgi:alkylation response protein AidB-like acyl-CoA dehydrogenase